MSRSARFALVAVFCCLLGCEAENPPAPSRGQAGVFYGGQIQELEVVELTPVRLPTFGFRVEINEPGAHRVRWSVTRPGPLGRRVTELGQAEIPAGQARLDQKIALEQTSPVGTWNVRVTVDEQLVVDRAFLFRTR